MLFRHFLFFTPLTPCLSDISFHILVCPGTWVCLIRNPRVRGKKTWSGWKAFACSAQLAQVSFDHIHKIECCLCYYEAVKVTDWCTSSPSLSPWEIPLWCIHQSGTLSTKMNPKAMTLHISLPHSPRTTASYFAFSPFPSFYNFPTLKYMTSFFIHCHKWKSI